MKCIGAVPVHFHVVVLECSKKLLFMCWLYTSNCVLDQYVIAVSSGGTVVEAKGDEMTRYIISIMDHNHGELCWG